MAIRGYDHALKKEVLREQIEAILENVVVPGEVTRLQIIYPEEKDPLGLDLGEIVGLLNVIIEGEVARQLYRTIVTETRTDTTTGHRAIPEREGMTDHAFINKSLLHIDAAIPRRKMSGRS